jgi:hypothetical protein
MKMEKGKETIKYVDAQHRPFGPHQTLSTVPNEGYYPVEEMISMKYETETRLAIMTD